MDELDLNVKPESPPGADSTVDSEEGFGLLTPEVLEKASRRLDRTAPARRDAEEKIRDKRYGELDTPERQQKRVCRLLKNPVARKSFADEGIDVTETLGAVESLGPADSVDPRLLERVIGGENFLGVVFFDMGRRAARAVAKVEIRNRLGMVRGAGTGSLVSPRLLLTNNHVLGDADAASFCRAVFDFEDGLNGMPVPPVTFRLEPETFFFTDPDLDFTLVAVAPASEAPPGAPLSRYGFLPLFEEEGKIQIGECVNVIQHPSGLVKQVVLQDNQFLAFPPPPEDMWLHYVADTQPGSSGAPLFNNEWEVVGLHHAGKPKRNAEGKILRIDGDVWERGMDERLIDWEGNEGVRASRILRRLRGELSGLRPEWRALANECLSPSPPSGGTDDPHAPDRPPDGQLTKDSSAKSVIPQSNSFEPPMEARDGLLTRSDGAEITFSIPLSISIRVGGSEVSSGDG